MTLDAEARALAYEMLNEYGKNCALVKTAAGDYDPETGTASVQQYAHNVKAYLEAPNRDDFASGLVVQSDEIAIFPALNLLQEPEPGDIFMTSIDPVQDWAEFFFGGGQLVSGDRITARTIKSVARVWSGEQVALYRVAVSG